MAIASDENPWSMDEPTNSQQPYFDLSTGGQGPFAQRHEKDLGDRPNETVVPKSAPFNGAVGGPGKTGRDPYFGYAGPQSQIDQRGLQENFGQYGGFPPVNGATANPNKSIPSRRSPGRVEFDGKSFGAFPPAEGKPIDRKRQQWQAFQAHKARRQRQKLSAFANIAPPPVPEPAPPQVYPYSGPAYGTGIAPPYGANGYGVPGYGIGGYGAGALGYNPSLVPPALPGLPMQGFRW